MITYKQQKLEHQLGAYLRTLLESPALQAKPEHWLAYEDTLEAMEKLAPEHEPQEWLPLVLQVLEGYARNLAFDNYEPRELLVAYNEVAGILEDTLEDL